MKKNTKNVSCLKQNIKKLLVLGDGIVYRCNGEFYVLGLLDLDYILCFDKIENVILFSRIYDVDEERIAGFNRLDLSKYGNYKIEIIGIENQSSGLLGYVKTMGKRWKLVNEILKEPSVIMSSFVGPAGLIANYCINTSNHILIERLLGDIDVIRSMKKFRFASLITSMQKVALKHALHKCELQTWVSYALEKKYAVDGVPSIVYNDNHLLDKQIISSVRKRVGNEPLQIAFLGRLSPEKGIVDLIKSIIPLQGKIRLSIIGGGVQEPELKQMIADNQLEEVVSLYGYMAWGEKLLEILRKQHLFVLPSYSEGLPTAIIEAMSCGLPVIATRVGGIPEIVKDNVNGFLYEAGNVGELTECIARMETDEKLRQVLAKEAIKYAKLNTHEKQLERLKCGYDLLGN